MTRTRYLRPGQLEHQRRLELLRLLRRAGAEVAERWPRLRDVSWQEELRYRRRRMRDLQDESD